MFGFYTLPSSAVYKLSPTAMHRLIDIDLSFGDWEMKSICVHNKARAVTVTNVHV